MSKSVNKIEYENIEQISQAAEGLKSIIGGYADNVSGKIKGVIKRSITYKIIQASSNARLSACDEKFFEYYSELMASYRELIRLCREAEQGLPEHNSARRILDGINSVLSSQISQATHSAGGENPIALEKKQIVTNVLSDFIKSFDLAWKEFILSHSDAYHKQCAELVLGEPEPGDDAAPVVYILEELEKNCFQEFYSEYVQGYKSCHTGLNNIESRTSANFYYEQLSKEQEILRSLITVQISALERKCQEGVSRETGRSIISEFISRLQEIHQRFGIQVSEATEHMSGEPTSHAPESFETFAEYIREQTKPEQITTSNSVEQVRADAKEAFKNFKEYLEPIILEKIDNTARTFDTNIRIYELQKEISLQLIMAQEIKDAFETVVKYNNEHVQELSACEHADIIKAICETIEIKNESISENKDAFAVDSQKYVDLMKNEKSDVTPEGLDEYCRAVFLAYITDMNLEAALNVVFSPEMSEQLRLAFDRKQSAHADSAAKKIFQFKKEHLLYEISTFEEILNFSVSRIRGSQDENSLGFVEAIDGVVDNIQIILRKSGIDMIRPSAHDMFNGKEHEVLMAEKSEDFQKGEIIKTMNSGYRQGPAVILRANVVAAK